jgi:hypothetical protein
MTKAGGARLARLAIATTALVLLSTSAAAAAPPSAPVKDLPQVVESARLWALGIIAAVATLFLIIGAGRYVIAGGDPGEVERAKLAIKSAMFGYALALLAPALLTVLHGIVGG